MTTGPGTMDPRVAAYLDALPPKARRALDALRDVVRDVLPHAQERISYGMPTFVVNGRSVVHLAAWKQHLSLYPVPDADEELAHELAPYRSGQGTLRFRLDEPAPLALVRRVVEQLAEQRRRALMDDR